MSTTRRNLLKTMLLGAGGLGLRGLAAGIPASLLSAGRAAAQTADACDAVTGGPLRPQKLILLTSASGDPLNANVPGTYVDGIYHAPDAGFSPSTASTIPLGGADRRCAAPWATLLADHAEIANRICFFHHGTYTVAHGDHAKVNAYMGAIRRDQMLCGLFANRVHTCYTNPTTHAATPTTQAAPVLINGDNLIRYQGAVLPVLDRNGLHTLLLNPAADSTAARLRQRRDDDQRALRDLLAPTATPAQRSALDAYVKAQADARTTDQGLVGQLQNPVGANEQQRLNSVAVTLLAMNFAPVVVMKYNFGGDNHDNMWNEVNATRGSVADLGDLWQKLFAANLHDDVTIVAQNVFGRTLGAGARARNPNGLTGRDHNAGHHCTVVIGRGFSGSVIGGVVPTPGGDFRADSINSVSGAQGGDISYEQGFGSLAKTLCVGMGLTRAVVEDQITIGKVVEGALLPDLRQTV